ncbi:hypothetical protein KKD37_00400 [Patescibacteria group bacterium]|nr:hypothetical protein [Patescibacteria group bacterium]
MSARIKERVKEDVVLLVEELVGIVVRGTAVFRSKRDSRILLEEIEARKEPGKNEAFAIGISPPTKR